MSKLAIFPGSFDPMTFGHLDLIERASKMFDRVIVLIAINTSKKQLFNECERRSMLEKAVVKFDNVEIDVLQDGLVAHYYREKGATALIRGVRNMTDFEYEANIAVINEKQCPGLETVLLVADEQYRYLSSSLIKEIAHFQGDLSAMVPEHVAQAMLNKNQSATNKK
ncbi:pantetheine-phosphate adenylyltransferase [Vaginisenegalia massiliensis]|uniref:pantetheine-phosphate adenylyltransferase n=1 Tax=Vaginisenegalia massiliensis TaxID=2058294 RepID=UPI000F53156F|nr:pantetheine-phosphate adenylyltransferase [Vaginisenegalia massiliensis]